MKKTGVLVFAIAALAVFLMTYQKPDAQEEQLPATSEAGTQDASPAIPVADSVKSVERIPVLEPEVPELSRDMVPTHLHPLFGWKDVGGYVPRRRMVESLESPLSADEAQALLMFARSKPANVGLSESDFNGVGDVVLLKLEEQEQLPADYTDHLVVMFYDDSLNTTWRDYCLQHLGTVYPRTPKQKRPVIDQLYADAIVPGSQFAGTTLLSMKRSAEGNGLSQEWVADRAMGVADSNAYGDAERLSALHVVAEFNHPEAINLAREITVSKHTVPFRAAALAVIGLNGEVSDRPLLEKYSKSSDIRLRAAAQKALKTLSQ